MGAEAHIDFYLHKSSRSRDIVFALLNSGWNIDFDGEVSFLMPEDIDNYDWKAKDAAKFDFSEFIDSHGDLDRIGISMVFDGRHGGEFLISSNFISFSISINRIYLFDRVPDFSIYIKKLFHAINGFGVREMRCDYSP